jgi:ADP-ribose pyrophosphatase YjhB (NUDIX family)
MREETALDVELVDLLGVYSDPARDPRGPTISAVYVGRARGTPRAGDDALDAGVFGEADLPGPLVFDHARILDDYFGFRRTGKRPRPA